MSNIKTSFGYTIYFEDAIAAIDQFIASQSYSKIVILGDSNTLEHCLPYLNLSSTQTSKADVIEIDPGEENKNIDICIGVWSMMQDFEMDRHSLLINLGGGVITDFGGFAASTYMRGIDFIHIPTSLMGMVDASIGGKTALDMQHFKNKIGSFAHPQAIFIIPELLGTLPDAELRSGFAEMIKHGLVADNFHLRDVVCHLADGLPELPQLIKDSLKIKLKIVQEDPLEKGLRKTLNFGHTVGHAIESYYLSIGKEVLHGNAIAAGMLVEAYLSEQHCGLAHEQYQYITKIVSEHLEPAKINADMVLDLIGFMKGDKKNRSGNISFSLLSEIAAPKLDVVLTEAQINEALIHCIHFFND